jgi:outer membrane protein
LPPTFSIQYHFAPDAKFQPYFGVGLNWTTFFNTDLEPVLSGFTLDLDDSFGVAVELGGDLQLAENWVLQFDLRWISIESDATLSDGVDSETFTVDINPLVYALNVGYKFN